MTIDITPWRSWKAVTPSDTVNMPAGAGAIYVGGSGNLQAVDKDNNVVAFAVTAGQIVNISPKRINATSNTATGLVALFG